jgi:hypothetical protein
VEKLKEIQNLFQEAKKENIQISTILVGDVQEHNLGINRFSVASGLCLLTNQLGLKFKYPIMERWKKKILR